MDVSVISTEPQHNNDIGLVSYRFRSSSITQLYYIVFALRIYMPPSLLLLSSLSLLSLYYIWYINNPMEWNGIESNRIKPNRTKSNLYYSIIHSTRKINCSTPKKGQYKIYHISISTTVLLNIYTPNKEL